MAQRSAPRSHDFPLVFRGSEEHSHPQMPEIFFEGTQTDKLEGYLQERIAQLDMEIKLRLAAREENYQWGKLVGRLLECKEMLSWLRSQHSSSASPSVISDAA